MHASDETFPDLTVSLDRDALVIRCIADVDLLPVGAIERAVDAAITIDPPAILLACEAITFVDSGGLQILLTAAHHAADANIPFAISAGPQLRRVVELVGLEETLGLIDVEQVEDWLASFRPQAAPKRV